MPPPLVLLHGLGSLSTTWSPVVDLLSREREVVVIPLPGHGSSSQRARTVVEMVDLVEKEFKERGLVGASVVGSSLGGQVALHLAERGVAGDVVLVDPSGFQSRLFQRTLGVVGLGTVCFLRMGRRAVPWVARRHYGRAVTMWPVSPSPTELPAPLVAAELLGFASPAVLPVFVDLLKSPPPHFASPTGRVTIVWGRWDWILPSRYAARAMEAFPGALLVTFLSSGHYPHWCEPEAFARLVLERA